VGRARGLCGIQGTHARIDPSASDRQLEEEWMRLLEKTELMKWSWRFYISQALISDPKGKAASVVLTETGAKLSKELFFKHFGAKE
jgi:hypothetical protein